MTDPSPPDGQSTDPSAPSGRTVQFEHPGFMDEPPNKRGKAFLIGLTIVGIAIALVIVGVIADRSSYSSNSSAANDANEANALGKLSVPTDAVTQVSPIETPPAATAVATGPVASTTAAAAIGVTVTPVASSTLPTYKVGQPVSFTQVASGKGTITVNSVTLNSKPANQSEASANGQFVVVDVTVTASSGNFQFSSAAFTITTPDQRVWAPAATNYFDPGLTSGTLSSGQSIRGNIAFDIEPGAITCVNALNYAGGEIQAIWMP
jgi:hypothetical protein